MVGFEVLTLFPGIFEGFVRESIIGKAAQEGLISINVTNIRDFAEGRHKVTDDYPFGGGCGMVMKAEPIMRALEHISSSFPEGSSSRVIITSPQGRPFSQEDAKRLASYDRIVVICGHYEGIDERLSGFADEEISIGDFVLTGGEIPAMAIIDSVSRMVPRVLGHEQSAGEDSFYNGLLDYPHYTQPREWRGIPVPEVLLSGDHEKIRTWRRKQALKRTLERRPDLLENVSLSEEDRMLLYDMPIKRARRAKKACTE